MCIPLMCVACAWQCITITCVACAWQCITITCAKENLCLYDGSRGQESDTHWHRLFTTDQVCVHAHMRVII
jgi:hypothetical protein